MWNEKKFWKDKRKNTLSNHKEEKRARNGTTDTGKEKEAKKIEKLKLNRSIAKENYTFFVCITHVNGRSRHNKVVVVSL